jgi:RNA polymerase-binding transcription factor DksA
VRLGRTLATRFLIERVHRQEKEQYPCFTLLKMTKDTANLGQCPECGEAIPDAWRLVEYETDTQYLTKRLRLTASDG